MHKTFSQGTVHALPEDFRAMIDASPKVYALWEDITPLARNEWICWVTSAKLQETRERRIGIAKSKMLSGERRPCCWAGCLHREKKG
ncbi:YdeI/OmpD-associated family protein [Candidatus Nomurabacteria bacterium]|nr:YdeI/OmpD-associated family protein [Candidatus Nomurabacteria bacterium]